MSFTNKAPGLIGIVFSAVTLAAALAADPDSGGRATCNLLNEKSLSLD